jgi:hypothetical protein
MTAAVGFVFFERGLLPEFTFGVAEQRSRPRLVDNAQPVVPTLTPCMASL